MKICIIGPMEKGQEELWLLEEARKKFDRATYAEIPYLRIRDGSVYMKNLNLMNFDCIIPRIPRTYKNYGYTICKLLENKIFIPFNPESIMISHNKFLTLIALDRAEIPIPKTYLALTRASMEPMLDKIKYPVVIKLLYGSLGKGVMFAESRKSAVPLLDTIETMDKPFLFERYIENPGEDIRALVVGNRVVAAMKRKAGKDERRANVGIGGKTEKKKLSMDMQDLAVRTAKALGLGIAGIDIIESNKGPLVIEANVNVLFKGLTEATSINVAEHMIEYMKEETEIATKGQVIGNFFKMIDRLKFK